MILGQTVTPSEGEVLIKSYQCTEYKSRIFGIRAKGYLEVTNQRILFQALGKSRRGTSVIHSEAAINNVSGIKIFKGHSLNWIKLIVSFCVLILLIFFLFMYQGSEGVNLPGFGGTAFLLIILLLFIIVFILIKTLRKPVFSLVIQTKGGDGNVVQIVGSSPFAVIYSRAAKALTGRPAEDSELLFKEIGALISDVQNMGEKAIEKWKK